MMASVGQPFEADSSAALNSLDGKQANWAGTQARSAGRAGLAAATYIQKHIAVRLKA
jgi:hypothetical protein